MQREEAPPLPLQLSLRSQVPRTQLTLRLCVQLGVERPLEHELECLFAGVFEQMHYLVLVKSKFDLSHG